MKLSQDEENLLIQRIRENPELARCMLERKVVWDQVVDFQ